MKNRAHHAGINRTPYKAMFGDDPRVRFTTTNLLNNAINTINVDDDLKNFTDTQTRREEKSGNFEYIFYFLYSH